MFLCNILALCFAEGSGQQVRIGVLVSSSTPADLRQAVLQPHPSAFESVQYSPFADTSKAPIPYDGMLDLLWSEPLSRLYMSSSRPEVPLINGNEYRLKGVKALEIEAEAELKALSRVSRWLGVRRLCVLLSPLSPWDIQTLLEGTNIEELRVPEDSEPADLDAMVRRLIVPFGFTSFLILLPPHTTKSLLLKFTSCQLAASRLTILLSSRAAQYRFNVESEELVEFRYISPLFVTNRGCAAAETVGELLLCQAQLSLAAGNSPETTIMRVDNRTARAIGRVSAGGIEFNQHHEDHLQPNRSEVSPVIPISLNGGNSNPSGSSSVPQALAAKGTLLAVKDINSRLGILPYFTLQVANLSLGVDEFNATWVQGRLEKSELGVALITGVFSSVTYEVYNLLRDLNISIPQVGATTTLPQFSSKVQFPLFTRVAMSDAYLAVIYTRLMKYFKWTHAKIIFIDNIWSETLAHLIVMEAKKLNIDVNNDRSKVAVGVESNSTELQEMLQEVVDSKVRVVIIIAYGDTLLAILEALYTLGMRRGDLIIIAVEWLIPSLYDIQDPDLLRSVVELTQGAIMFFPSSFIDPVGPAAVQRFAEEYQERMSVHGCYYYDAALSVAHALDFVVSKGMNWKDPVVLDSAVRGVHFTGCTGLVTIEEGTNDRAPTTYTIFNARMQADGIVKIEAIGDYDPSGVVLFQFSEDIQWPGFGASVPADLRANVPGCPFEQSHDINYQPAMVLSAAIISGVCLVSIFSSVHIWKKYWNFEASPLRKQASASFEDSFVFIVMAVEAAQLLAVGLQLRDWATLLQWSARLSAIRFEAFKSMGSRTYWGIFYAAIAAIGLWVALLILAKVRPNHWWKCVCKRAGTIAKTACPILGDIAFIPIVSTLLAIFQCPKVVSKPSEDPSLHRAYLEWDCHQLCWSEWHLALSVVSCICLLIYIPSAVYMRPAWQHVPTSLHIHSSPAFLMLKSIYQVSIVGVDRTLKSEYPTWASVAFLVLTISYGAAASRIKPFNYSRANLWFFLSLLFVTYTAVLHVLDAHLSATSGVLWLVLLVLGFLSTFTFGWIYQRIKLPSKFISSKRIGVTELFRFMLSRSSKYLHIFARPNIDSSDASVMTHRRVPLPQDFIESHLNNSA